MHHVATRSIAEEVIFRNGGDYTTGVGILAALVAEGLLRCHAFCFMPTHYHVLGTFENLSAAVHHLNRRYAVAYNRRYNRRGHVFDSPFSRTPIESVRQARNTLAYIALNPDDPEGWHYSSYPGAIGLAEPFSFVDTTIMLDAFGTPAAFREFVDLRREARDMNLVL